MRIAAFSAITLAGLGGILMVASGSVGVGIVVLVFAVLLGLAFYRSRVRPSVRPISSSVFGSESARP